MTNYKNVFKLFFELAYVLHDKISFATSIRSSGIRTTLLGKPIERGTPGSI